jgi:mRNA interferase RelE/StbE
MEITFLDKFNKDLDKIKDKTALKSVQHLIQKAELANNLHDLPHVKKLEGYKSAIRIRIGDYRVGIFMKGNTIEFARIVHRKDIYRSFP